MLDIIRRKASSWVTRAIFVVVVLVFIFFFGYNQIDTPNQGPQAVLVRVNGTDIRQNEFNLAFKSTLEMYKQVFKGNIPEGMNKMVASSALQQLVNERLMIDAAHDMGLRVSDEELAKTIESDKRFQRDGVFDRTSYRDIFLPSFQREFGLSYEELLRNELLARKLNELLQGSVKVSPEEAKTAYWQDKTQFTFEVTKIGPGQTAPTKQTVGPVSLADRQKILEADATAADYAKVFALTAEKPQLDAPIVIRDIQYSVKLIKREIPTDADWKKDEAPFTKDLLTRKQAQMSQEWIESLAKKADIEQLQTPNEG
jgi:peptidyl-prolyl cis-trans isomerase D